MPVFTGETYDTRTQRAEQLPDLGRDEGNPDPFTFISSPGSWECIDLEAAGVPETERSARWEWVPRVKKFHHRPGVNGISARAGGLGRALGEYREKGWTVIDPEHGPEGRSYVQRIRTRRGFRFADVWTSYVPVGIGRVAPRFDDLGFLQWRRELVRAGVVKTPPPEVLEGAVELVQREISRLEARAHLPHIQERIAGLIAKVEGMRQGNVASAAPKRRRSTK